MAGSVLEPLSGAMVFAFPTNRGLEATLVTIVNILA